MVKKISPKNAKSSDEKNKLLTLLKGVMLAYIITIPFFMLFSLILSYTNFPENYISPAVMLTTLISIVISSIIVSKSINSRGWLVGGVMGFIYMLILYIFSGVVFKNFSISKYLMTMTLVCMAAGSVGGIMGVNIKSIKRKRARTKY